MCLGCFCEGILAKGGGGVTIFGYLLFVVISLSDRKFNNVNS